MIAWVIEEEFGVAYHPGHVRKLPHMLDFSVQRPRRVVARANPVEQDRWHRLLGQANSSTGGGSSDALTDRTTEESRPNLTRTTANSSSTAFAPGRSFPAESSRVSTTKQKSL